MDAPSMDAPDRPGSTGTGRRVLLNTGALAGSSLWRIALSFVLQILIANRLGEVGLGQYATALAYLNVTQILSSLGLPMLLVRDLARAPGERRRHFYLALVVQLLAGVLAWAGLVGLTLLLPYQPTTRLALVIIGASLPLFAVTSVSETIFQAGERMELVMGVEMTVNSLILVLSLLVLWRGGTVVHLAGVMVVTQSVSAALCLALLRRSRLLSGDGPGRRLATLARDLRELLGRAAPFYGLTLANVLLQRLDILLLSVLAGEAITGIYSAAYLVVRVLIILSQTFWQALYPTLSRLRHQAPEQYRRLAVLGLRYGLMLLLPAAALGAATGDGILALLFSAEGYQASVPVFRVLIWTAPLFFISTYAVNLLLVERLPGQSLFIVGAHLLALVLLLPPLVRTGQALGAAAAMTGAIAVSMVTGLLLLRGIRAPLGEGRPFLALLLAAGVALAVASLAPLAWPLRLLLGGAAYLAGVWWSGVLAASDLLLFRKALQR